MPEENNFNFDENLDEEDASTKLQYDIMLSAADLTTEDLNKKMKENVIEIPPFQRGYVWTIKQASKLIDSFMMGLPIPPIFLYLQENQKYLLIDGGQRLRTIQYFYNGIFNPQKNPERTKPFRLEGLNPKNHLACKTFEDFNDVDKQFFKNQILRAIIIRQVQPKGDNTSIYHIFERLNTGGTSLKNQEVRNCVYAGKFNDFLNQLNEYENWRSFLGTSQHLPRKKDVELILRYLAFLHTWQSYQRPMKDYLSNYMAEHRNPQNEFLELEEKRFKKICDMLVDTFGERSLHKKGAFPTAVFDSVFVALGKHFEEIPDNLFQRIQKLRENENFRIATTKATMDVGKVQTRIELAEKYLFTNHV